MMSVIRRPPDLPSQPELQLAGKTAIVGPGTLTVRFPGTARLRDSDNNGELLRAGSMEQAESRTRDS